MNAWLQGSAPSVPRSVITPCLHRNPKTGWQAIKTVNALIAFSTTTNCRGCLHIFGWSGVPSHPTTSPGIHDCRWREALERIPRVRFVSDEYEGTAQDQAAVQGRSWLRAADDYVRHYVTRHSPPLPLSIGCHP